MSELIAAGIAGFVVGFIFCQWRMHRRGYVLAATQCKHWTRLAGVKCMCVRPHNHKGSHLSTAGKLVYWSNGDSIHVKSD